MEDVLSREEGSRPLKLLRIKLILAAIILVFGLGGSVWFGATSLGNQMAVDQVRKNAELIYRAVELALETDYVALLSAQVLMADTSKEERGKNFEALVSELKDTVNIASVTFFRELLHEDREAFEREKSEMVNEIMAFENNSYRVQVHHNTGVNRVRAPNASSYFIIEYAEPMQRNHVLIGYDALGSTALRQHVEAARETHKPRVAGPIKLLDETDPNSFGVTFMFPLENEDAIVQGAVRISELVSQVVKSLPMDMKLHMYLDGLSLGSFAGGILKPLVPVEIEAVAQDNHLARFDFEKFSRHWSVIVVSEKKFSALNWVLAITPATVVLFILVALLGFYLGLLRKEDQRHKTVALQATKESRAVADAEKQLNEFLAHEVRNPLSVAISANKFAQNAVDSATWKHVGLQDAAEKDLSLVGDCLCFIHELLDNMLDLSKFSKGEVTLRITPLSVRDDVLIPIKAMLDKQSSNIKLIVETDDLHMVHGDALRLKQIVLNLAKNSTKFVEEGFIRLIAKASPDPGKIIVIVEDSGPGIPESQRSQLFERYQVSLDMLRQGTGMGLALCKVLTHAMHGKLKLDESYNSGIPGRPGARFIIEIPLPKVEETSVEITASAPTTLDEASALQKEHLRAMIIDDDALVRVVTRRRLNRLFPNLKTIEVASGEAALSKGVNFDLIFVDQYMPGPNLPLTGDEVIQKLRSQNCRSIIVGMSANNVAHKHVAAGADSFFQKPFTDDALLKKNIMELLQQPPIRNVLIVDDEGVNRHILSRSLMQICPRCTICEAENEAEVKLRLEKDKYDLIILDEHLQSAVTGSQIAAQLRETGYTGVLISLSGSKGEILGPFDASWGKPMPSKSDMRAELLSLFPRRTEQPSTEDVDASL